MPLRRVLASDETSMEQIKKAVELRSKALAMQNKGNYFEAIKVLSEAVSLYPQYSQAYCDLGILYESLGVKKDAEILYLKSLEIDPGYLAACTNLALLYESMQDFPKAACYWQKRAELGAPNDKWTQKAKERLSALSGSVPMFVSEDKVKKDIINSSDMIKKERVIASKNKELSFKEQEIAALKENKEQELLTKQQEINLLNQQMESVKEKSQQELTSLNQQINQLSQQLNTLQQENEKKLSAKDEKIKALEQKVLYVQQQSEAEIADKQQEVAKAAEQLTELIGSLREDFTTFRSQDTQQLTAKQ